MSQVIGLTFPKQQKPAPTNPQVNKPIPEKPKTNK